MSEKNKARAVAYYQAMSNKDLKKMEEYLHPEVRFLSPLSEITGKSALLDLVKPLVGAFNKLTIRNQFATDDQVMLAYDIDFPAPLGQSRTAALLTFQEGLITRYELFFDATPFQKK